MLCWFLQIIVSVGCLCLEAITSARHFFISGSVENVQLMGSDKHCVLVWCSYSREALTGAESHKYCALLLFLLFSAFLPMISTSATSEGVIIWISLSLLTLDWWLEYVHPPCWTSGVLLENVLSAPVVKHGDNGNKHTRGWIKVAQEIFRLVSALLWT